ncbi:hypothetical protein [Rathayibacter iranicus]|uniref:hypothetical protein n=1 Tax=Rathayibacter iranicus TaxID=59737 RepID=UPI000FD953B5|nr:hypothetical protein [Rathayibacter iranicus]MWV30920.1 hypothetical protein [Rathayibacter iranicus NCPPB 2253 = VKM Ac-1602]
MGKIIKQAFAIAAAATMASVAVSPATTASEKTVATDAKIVYDSVVASPDPEVKLQSLTPQEKSLFEIWIKPTSTQMTTTESNASAMSALDNCRTYTTRGSFSNQVGAILGKFWTTGRACADNSSIVTADYVDGGGQTSAFGWSYVGSDTGHGVSDGAGFVYGSYHFKLNIGGIDIQQPSYCARSIFTLAASHGDSVCGIG